MGALGIVNALRKLRYFLAVVFPGFERIWATPEAALARITRRAAGSRTWERLKESRFGRIAAKLIRNFLWSNYSKTTIDPAALPREVVVILKPVFLLAAALCLLLPLAMEFPRPGIPAGAIDGAKGPVAVWSVLLWLLCLVAGWSCLIAGSIASNRLVLLISLILFLYFMGGATMGLPRSTWNCTVPLLALAAAGMGERYRSRPGKRDMAAGAIFCILVGSASGLALIALTPAARLFSGHILAAGLLIGALIGALIFAFHRFIAKPRPHIPAAGVPVPVNRIAAFIASFLALYLGTVTIRGGWASPASATASFLTLWTGYLWPLYYLIGVGVVFKFLGQAELFTETLQGLLPRRLYGAAAILMILAATLIAWSPFILDTPAFPWPNWINKSATILYQKTSSWIWANFIIATTWEWLRWVLLWDVGALAWSAVRRKLDSKRITALLFGTVLLWSGMLEYMYQFSGFARTGAHSAFFLFSFSIVILWLVHKVGLQFCTGTSEHWSLSGRFGIYAGVLLFVLLSLHVRGAVHDTRIMDEIFLYFFDGMIGIGLPYYLYIYAGRRFAQLPISLSLLFSAFAFGAALTLPLIAADKLVAAGGSFSSLAGTLQAQREVLLTAGLLPQERPALPSLWITVRSVIAMGGWIAFACFVRRRAWHEKQNQAAIIFLIIASAMGFASFSRMRIELPLMPVTGMLLLSPYAQVLVFDANLIAGFVTCGIPALILGLNLPRPRANRSVRPAAAVLAAFFVYIALALVWPAQEPWFRSTGVWITGGLACLLLLTTLFFAARGRIEESLASNEPASAVPAVSARKRFRAALASTGLIVLAGIALYQTYQERAIMHALPGVDRPVPVPAAWKLKSPASANGGLFYTRPSYYPRKPTFRIDWVEGENTSPKEVLDSFVSGASSALSNFSARKAEKWDSRFPGAMAVDFDFEQKLQGGEVAPVIGTKLVLPFRNQGLLVLTLLGGLDDWQERRWDMIRIAESMRGAAQ